MARIPAGVGRPEGSEVVPSLFGQIVTVAAMVHEPESAGHSLRETHSRLVHRWLAAPLEFRVRDMVEYLGGFGEKCLEVTRELLKRENDDDLLPIDLDDLHREHFEREMEVLLPLVIVQLPGAVPLEREEAEPGKRQSDAPTMPPFTGRWRGQEAQ